MNNLGNLLALQDKVVAHIAAHPMEESKREMSGIIAGVAWERASEVPIAVHQLVATGIIRRYGNGKRHAYALALAILGLMLATGCARFTSRQIETACDGTQRTTIVRVLTLLDAHTDLAKLRTTMTEKSQGIGLSGLDQSTSSTNAVEMLRLIAAIVGTVAK